METPQLVDKNSSCYGCGTRKVAKFFGGRSRLIVSMITYKMRGNLHKDIDISLKLNQENIAHNIKPNNRTIIIMLV